MENWNDGMVEWWNVEALAEIPLLREKNGRMERWNPDSYRGKIKMKPAR